MTEHSVCETKVVNRKHHLKKEYCYGNIAVPGRKSDF